MTEERPSTNPAVQAAEGGTPAPDTGQPPASMRRDPGRVPAIPGLIAPRFVSRQPLEPSVKPPPVGGEGSGLMRPQLPYRKPQTTPQSEAPSFARSMAASEHPVESAAETAAPPPVIEQPLLQQRPAQSSQPQARHVPLEAHRPTADSTLTAMRIISIGIEDDPAACEATYEAAAKAESPVEDRQAAIVDLPVLDEEQLFPIYPPHRAAAQGELEHDEPQPQPEAFAQPNIAASGSELGQKQAASLVEPLPSFDLPEPTDVGTPTQKLPSFELADTGERAHRASTDSGWSRSTSSAPEIAVAPLPSFELPETDEPPVAAVERLPAFELESPEPNQDEAPRVIPSARLDVSTEGQRDVRVGASPAAPPPKPARAAAPTIVLSDDDLAPDSGKRAPPMPPSRAVTKGAVEPSLPPDARGSEARTADSDVAQPAKRNPPRPPQRRSYPALADDTAQEGPASTAVRSRPSDTSDAATEKARADEKTGVRARRPWWEELFNEDFSRALGRLSDEQIRREASFIEESLGITPGAVVLDLGCGAGYHAVELANRGYAMVGYDLSLHQLALAADVAQEKRQKLNLMQGDMREMAFDSVFDGIYCWDTTFGYFEEEKNVAVAARIFQALKPGGTFLVDVINRDFVTMQQPSSVWFEGDSAVCMDDMSVDFISSRLKVKRSVMLDDGRTKECHYSIRLYSLHELGKILHEVGFRIAEASGQPSTPGVFMGQNAPRIIILAQRP